MVVTRSRSRGRVTAPNPRIGMRQQRRWMKRYKPQDTAHRHRLADTQPKSQTVVAYRRRT